MKEITNKRLLRWSLASFLVMVLIAFTFNVGIASAETGSLIIDSDSTNSYTTTQAGAFTSSWNSIRFDTSNYDTLSSIYFQFLDSPTFAYETRSTTFTITGGGSGSGIVTYNKNSKTINWICDVCTITSSPFTLTYVTNIFADIGQSATTTAPLTPDVTHPVYVNGDGGTTKAGYYSVSSSRYVRNDYNVTYLPVGDNMVFNVSIDKSYSSVPTKIEITNYIDVQYFIESAFNTNSFSFVDVYDSGISLNMSISDGSYDFVVVNITDIPESEITGSLSTDKTSYNRTEFINITYNLSEVSTGRIRIVQPDGDTYIKSIAEGLNQTYLYYIPDSSLIGSWMIYLDAYEDSIYQNYDYVEISVLNSGNPVINFQYDVYTIGDSMTINYIAIESGYYLLKDSSSNIKINGTVGTLDINNEFGYFLSQSSLTGIWTVELYNSTGIFITNDTTYINFGIVEPDATETPTVTETPTSILDITNAISEALVGKITNDNGEMDDVQVTRLGNKLYSTLLLVVLLCLLMGIYKKYKDSKR